MFGTTGYLVANPGMENDLKRYIENFGHSPNIVSICLYKIDSDKNDFIEFILWVDKAAHDETTSQPDFPAIYQDLLNLLADEPSWYSGEMIYESFSALNSESTGGDL
jgi:hypothetical protein